MTTKYKFSHRINGRYYWESTTAPTGDSRVEAIVCHVEWFWRHQPQVSPA